ncbi:MAG: bis(5'-nucleosyl)-tetraphosphatase (symmetrical) YqeK [Clostridiaceae bacterium]
MWNLEKINLYLKDNLKLTRYNHSIGVRDCAINLARFYGEDEKKAEIAGLVHDCAKNLSDTEILSLLQDNNIEVDKIYLKSPFIFHGLAGSIIARDKFGIEDKEILSAIEYHTTGKDNMSGLEKIIYLADYIEPNRKFKEVENLRELAYKDLNFALLESLNNTIKFVIEKNSILHEDTIKARNYLIFKEDVYGKNNN